MMRRARWLLAAVALICIGVALSYPIRHEIELRQNRAGMEALSAMRSKTLTAQTPGPATPEPSAPAPEPEPTPARQPQPTTGDALSTEEPAVEVVMPGYILYEFPGRTPAPDLRPDPIEPRLEPGVTPAPTVDPSRRAREGALPYPEKEKAALDEAKILPELREIWELNHDLVGWLSIPGTKVDYPVLQSEDREYYLHHDFFGRENSNGQLILDTNCDPYTPSYNLIISGHRMDSGAMFGSLPQDFDKRRPWSEHPIVEFDTLMERKKYVVFAAFYSADWDVNEAGFRYNVDIQYRRDMEEWLAQIRENQLYDTGIDVAFGDECITLTTCSRAHHRNGRFVLVCRRIREGEEFE